MVKALSSFYGSLREQSKPPTTKGNEAISHMSREDLLKTVPIPIMFLAFLSMRSQATPRNKA